MKKEHWICGGASCEAPLFRRSFWLDRTERFQSARLEICGLGYFLFYINGKRISDQELMPAMTDYASVLGCETTYPVWEERSVHRCRYLSFDLLPYLKAGENVLAVRLGNGWYQMRCISIPFPGRRMQSRFTGSATAAQNMTCRMVPAQKSVPALPCS